MGFLSVPQSRVTLWTGKHFSNTNEHAFPHTTVTGSCAVCLSGLGGDSPACAGSDFAPVLAVHAHVLAYNKSVDHLPGHACQFGCQSALQITVRSSPYHWAVCVRLVSSHDHPRTLDVVLDVLNQFLDLVGCQPFSLSVPHGYSIHTCAVLLHLCVMVSAPSAEGIADATVPRTMHSRSCRGMAYKTSTRLCS